MGADREQLRTRSGCNSCRQRRKKCDEVKPVCTRCRKGSVTCVWRTSQQLRHDGRLRSNKSPTPTQAKTDSLVNSRLLSETKGAPQPDVSLFTDLTFDVSSDSALFSYYMHRLLPRSVHQTSDFSYWLSMACHQPLMDAAVACAGMSMSHKVPHLSTKLRQKALTHQTSAVASVREFINSGCVTGEEDWLLATVETLVLSTHRDADAVPARASPHVVALMEIFKYREAAAKSRARSSAELQFERICYESMLYHASIFTWFDSSFEVADGFWDQVHGYFQHFAPGGSPILGVPYTLFKLITTVSTLGRSSTPDLNLAKQSYRDLTLWKTLVDAKEYSVAKFYVFVAYALVQHILGDHQSTDDSILQCESIMESIDIGSQFSGYHLWPVVVLRSLVDGDRRHAADEAISAVFRNMDGI